MRKRGRKTELAAVTPIEPRQGRPAPPEDLTEAQQQIWRAVVECMPPNWFRPAVLPILKAYTGHAERAQLIAAELDHFQAEWLKVEGGPERLAKLAAVAERETKLLLACARSLRITNQSRYDPAKATREVERTPAVSGPPPWDYEGKAKR